LLVQTNVSATDGKINEFIRFANILIAPKFAG